MTAQSVTDRDEARDDARARARPQPPAPVLRKRNDQRWCGSAQHAARPGAASAGRSTATAARRDATRRRAIPAGRQGMARQRRCGHCRRRARHRGSPVVMVVRHPVDRRRPVVRAPPSERCAPVRIRRRRNPYGRRRVDRRRHDIDRRWSVVGGRHRINRRHRISWGHRIRGSRRHRARAALIADRGAGPSADRPAQHRSARSAHLVADGCADGPADCSAGHRGGAVMCVVPVGRAAACGNAGCCRDEC